MIYSWSKFNYNQTVTALNNHICIDEGDGELIAEIEIGNYTLSEFVDAVADALNGVGTLTYTVTVERGGNVITISASGNFSILISSGTSTSSAYALMGFNQIVDLSGDDEYMGNGACGSEYYPQFLLQSYVAPEDWVESSDSTVNESADGRVEMIRFGVERKIEMDIKFITSLVMDGAIIKNNSTGLQDARDFFGYISQKKRFEFVPDVLYPDTFYKVILEAMPGSKNGTGFKLKELFAQNLPDIYETGVLTLRVVT